MKEENQAIIKALNMYGRVPEQWELLNDVERLNNIINKAIEYIYHWSTQRKIFFDKIDRHLNGKPRFYGDIADLLNILRGEDK